MLSTTLLSQMALAHGALGPKAFMGIPHLRQQNVGQPLQVQPKSIVSPRLLSMSSLFDQNRLSQISPFSVPKPGLAQKKEIESIENQEGKRRSVDLEAGKMKRHILPVGLIFDRGLVPSQQQPFLLNDSLQKNWHASVEDCGKTGPYKVHDYFLNLSPSSTGRTINAQVFAPCQFQKTGSAPVILMTPPGFIGEMKLPLNQRFYDIQPYTSFMRHFASMGFVVVGLFEHRGILVEGANHVDHKRDAEELKSITDQLLGDSSPIRETIDHQQLAVMGHSKGGKLSFYHAAIDPRVKVVLAIDPVNQGGPPWFISDKFSDNPVAPVPGVTPKGESTLMDQVNAKAVILRAPPDLVNFDKRFNAEHFWAAFKGDGVYVDFKAKHADWLFRQDLRLVTRRVFTAALMDVFHPDKPFADELNPEAIQSKNPALVTGVELKSNKR